MNQLSTKNACFSAAVALVVLLSGCVGDTRATRDTATHQARALDAELIAVEGGPPAVREWSGQILTVSSKPGGQLQLDLAIANRLRTTINLLKASLVLGDATSCFKAHAIVFRTMEPSSGSTRPRLGPPIHATAMRSGVRLQPDKQVGVAAPLTVTSSCRVPAAPAQVNLALLYDSNGHETTDRTSVRLKLVLQ